MMMKTRVSVKIASTAILLGCALGAFGQSSSPDNREELLRVREKVWRAWFANDVADLKELVPPETLVISSGEPNWKHQAEILQTAAQFQAKGGQLLRLEFPRTEIRRFGDVAVIYSQYALELEVGGKRSQEAGRVTEIFVKRDGKWTNPGWHTDSEK